MSEPISNDLRTRMQAPWEAGDFGAVAKTVGAPIARHFAQGIEAHPGAKMLDVACGTGSVTIPLAQRGFDVTGVDISPKLLAEARDRAAADNLQIRFDEGLVEELPYPDASFDSVVSLFGIMFSLLPNRAVAEIARVLKPRGKIVLGNWIEAGFSGKVRKAVGPYLPAPQEAGVSPDSWGDVSFVQERLASEFGELETKVVSAPWVIAASPREAAAFFIRSSGQLQLLIPQIGEEKAHALCQSIEALFVANNRSVEANSSTLIENMYLRVMATRR